MIYFPPMERPLPAIRIANLEARADELRLLIDPRRILSSDVVTDHLDSEVRARIETTSRLRLLLSPYAIACHASLTDALSHTENLIPPYVGVGLMSWWTKRRIAQFVLNHEDPALATFVSLRTQRVKIGNRNQELCLNATFVEAPKTYIKDRSSGNSITQYMSIFTHEKSHTDLGEKVDRQERRVEPNNIPFYHNYMTHLIFDRAGEVSDVIDHVGRANHLMWYRLNKNSFTAHRLVSLTSGDFGMFFAEFLLRDEKNYGSQYRYSYCEDGQFRAEPVTEASQSIEQEFSTILAKLPIQEF